MTLGATVARRDGHDKVTGRAIYAAEQRVAGLLHAVPVLSVIAAGRVTGIDARAAKQAPGVLGVITPDTMPPLAPLDGLKDGVAGEPRLPLSDDRVQYDGQIVALVVAETPGDAREAAWRVRVSYATDRAAARIEQSSERYWPKDFYGIADLQVRRGDPEAAIASADVVVEQTYETPVEHHNPMEPHATIAAWDDDGLTVYDGTQWLVGTRNVLAHVFRVPRERVRVVSPYVGGGFGSKGYVWPRTILAAAAAKQLGRPVKLALSRQETFSNNGHRGRTVQTLRLAASRSGALRAIQHHTLTQTSLAGVHVEPSGIATASLYACPNLSLSHEVARVNTGSPTATRAPGEASGMFALECAMDELAETLGLDPLELRRRNHAAADPETGKPFTAKHLLECYDRGASAFGWTSRDTRPRSMRAGDTLIGWGMATATYPANIRPASATVRLDTSGNAVVEVATHEIGTGTGTILAQIAADALDMPVERVRCEIGDSALPPAPVSGGSSTAASVGSAVHEAAHRLRNQIASGGRRACRVDFAPEALRDRFAAHSFGAHFVEVHVDEQLGIARVSRVVSAIDVGRVLNHRTVEAQVRGGVVWGIGMALMEATVYDQRSGRIVTRNFADYLVPVNPDVPPIEVILIDAPDPNFGPLGARGVGEIGITGTAAAIANAIHHATGRRIRRLPVTPAELL